MISGVFSRTMPNRMSFVCTTATCQALLVVGLFLMVFASTAQAQNEEFYGPFPTWLNVKTTYGAVGDGVADDTAALQAALDAALTDASIPNVSLRNMALGFRHVNDPAVLEPLVAPYFDALTTVWKTRSYKIAEYIISGFYPSPLVSQGLIDATNAWLDANPGIPALRRLVIEGLAGVERAVAAQERDRQA